VTLFTEPGEREKNQKIPWGESFPLLQKMDCGRIAEATQTYIGEGSAGAVYRVTIDGQECAVKDQPFRDNTHIYGEALREAVLLSSITHPYIIKLYHICTQDGRLKMVLEAGSENLEQWLSRESRDILERQEVAEYIEYTLQFLHEVGLYHNDLHLTNVVLVDGIPKLIDFGYSSPLPGRFRDDFWKKDLQLSTSPVAYNCPDGQFFHRTPLREVHSFPEAFKDLQFESETAHQMYDEACRLTASVQLEVGDDLTFRAALYCWALILRMDGGGDLTPDLFLVESEYNPEQLLDTVELLCLTLDFQLL
jgi:serine/threonine protein kinase